MSIEKIPPRTNSTEERPKSREGVFDLEEALDRHNLEYHPDP